MFNNDFFKLNIRKFYVSSNRADRFQFDICAGKF